MKKMVSDSKQVMGRHDGATRDQMIEMMDAALLNVPADQREQAVFEIDEYGFPYDPNTYYALFIKFKRPETDKEEATREKLEAEQEARRIKHEKKEYERLKKQFG